MHVTDAMVEAAVSQAYRDAATELDGSWMPPASAKVADHDDPADLRAADDAAHAVNLAAMRRILEAALRA